MKRLKGRFGIAVIAMVTVCILCIGILNSKVSATEKHEVKADMNALLEGIGTATENQEENDVATDPDAIMEVIDAMVEKDTMEYGFSSNPYDYINNQYFDNIVNLGIPALPVMVEEIEASEMNGLREYLFAIAVEEITKTSLKEKAYGWSNGKEWMDQWKIYLRNIPVQVDYIVNDTESTVEEKETALDELGMMSLPYIKDAIDAGHTEFRDIYDSIAGISASGSRTVDTDTVDESDVEIIRSMVEAVRVD
ncbi:MAG: hypothetical protein HDQ95_05045 [Roseburia sp.]|nr:hypothetical protein [Roseburia sp.]